MLRILYFNKHRIHLSYHKKSKKNIQTRKNLKNVRERRNYLLPNLTRKLYKRRRKLPSLLTMLNRILHANYPTIQLLNQIRIHLHHLFQEIPLLHHLPLQPFKIRMKKDRMKIPKIQLNSTSV